MGRAKELLFAQFALIGKAFSSPRRLELLEFLAQGEQTVEALVEKTGQSVANTSRHLQILREARVVEAGRKAFTCITVSHTRTCTNSSPWWAPWPHGNLPR